MAALGGNEALNGKMPARRPGATALWACAGVVYSVAMVYWPVIQEHMPPNLGLLRMFDFCVLMFIPLAALHSAASGRITLGPNSVLLSFYLLVLVSMVSLALSPLHSFSMLWHVFKYAEAYCVIWVFISLHDTTFESAFIWSIAAITVFETSAGLFQLVSSGGGMAGRGLASGRGIYELQILLALWGITAFAERKGRRLLELTMSAIGAAGVLITVIRTAYLHLATGAFVAYLLVKRSTRRVYAGVVAAMVAVALVSVTALNLQWPVFTERMQQIEAMSGSLGVRLVLWKALLFCFENNPLTGIGPGAFGRYQSYYLDRANLTFDEAGNDIGLSAHNTVVGFLGETGLLGLAAFAIYMSVTAKIARDLARKDTSPFNVALAGTVISGLLLDFIAGSSFHPITSTLVALAVSRYVHLKTSAGESICPACGPGREVQIQARR